MAIRIGDEAPDFTAETTEGTIHFHEWIGDKWAILFSHPKDFTPVCTTELGYMAGLKPDFDRRNAKVVGLSVDPVSDHARWLNDIKETQGHAVNYPLIGDADLTVAKLYDMIHPNATGGKRTAVENATVRSVFVIGPDKKVKAMIAYPMSTRRNFHEVLRLRESAKLPAKHRVEAPCMKMLMCEAAKNRDINTDLRAMPWPYDPPRRGDAPPGSHHLSFNDYTIRKPPYAKSAGFKHAYSYVGGRGGSDSGKNTLV